MNEAGFSQFEEEEEHHTYMQYDIMSILSKEPITERRTSSVHYVLGVSTS